MTRCLHCGADSTNGLALCELCRRLAASIFEMLPVYYRNLARQRRPGRPNGSLGITNQWLIVRGETEGSRILTVLERVVNDLDTWARALTDDRDILPPEQDTETETVAALCGFLETNLTSVATLEWAGQFLREMARHERTLRELTETVVPGWYAGTCRQVTGRDMEGNVFTCGSDTFVIPGLTWVTCGSCGATTYARDHLEMVLEEARDWVARPMRIAEALVALLDTEQSIPRLYERIKRWGQADRQKITPIIAMRRAHVFDMATERIVVGLEPVGPARYRFGEVFDMLLASGQTRLDASLQPHAPQAC